MTEGKSNPKKAGISSVGNQMCVGGMCFPKDLKLAPEKKAKADDSQPKSDHDGES